MTKIEAFIKERADHKSMAECAYKALNIGEHYRKDRDKHGLYLGSKWHDSGEEVGYLTGYSGFYGNSGCTYQCTPRLASYLVIVINKNMAKLVAEAIELSEKAVESKRLLAEQEAKDVLEKTTK